MKGYKLAATALALIIAIVPAAFGADNAKHAVSPKLVVGPQAEAASAASTNYGLFKCQVGLSTSVCYDPYQMRHAYGVDNLISQGYDGHGKTIVIVDAFQSPDIKLALQSFINFYGLKGMNGLGNAPDPSLGTFTQVAPDGLTSFDPSSNNMLGWAEEITLDVLWAHAIAPGANITLVLAKSNQDADILSATKYAVDNNLGSVISQSFGQNETCVDPDTFALQHQIFADATAKNITLFASAGDDDAAQGSCDGKSLVKAVSSPAVDPLVTAVGGTELHAAGYCLTKLGCDPTKNPDPGTYEDEIVWNETAFEIGTGGGFSVVYDEPSYQQGTIHGGKQRGISDVSYNAAVRHGVLTFLVIPGVTYAPGGTPAGGFFLFGGTSAGSPQWAAITAIADQKAGYDLGFINKALYHIGQAQSHYSAALNDVTVGNNSIGSIVGFSAAPGWDPPTGLGTPKGVGIVDNLLQFVSAGDGTSAIAQSAHAGQNGNGNGAVKPH